MQSDLSRLKLFIDSLPKDKVLSKWRERYIEDIRAMDGYSDAKVLAIKRERYVRLDDIMISGYSIKNYKSSCDIPDTNSQINIEINTNDESCSSCCEYDKETEKCEYDGEKCNRYFAKNVHNWNELCGYHILFLQGKTPGLPNHPAPWNKETSYIIAPLVRILKQGILTVESQPGLIVNDPNYDDEYIQKPYLILSGPAGRIHRILNNIFFPKDEVTFDNSIIKYVPYKIQNIYFNGYENYIKDNQDYVKVMVGIDNPPILSSQYTEYIFSNRFFNRIADIVENTE